MSRSLSLLLVALAVAGCSPTNPDLADASRAYVVVDNQSLSPYELFADGVRVGRVAPKTTRRFPFIGTVPGAFVRFTAQSRTSVGVMWNPIPIEPGAAVGLTIQYRPPQ